MFSRRAAMPPLLLTVVALCGCGVETYHARIVENSIPFFQYQQELDANLGARWRKGELSVRLPAELKALPDPKEDDGGRDPRIPRGLALEELTGLLGGFYGELEGADPARNGVAAPFTALILSNRVLLASRDPDVNPEDFDNTLLNRLSEGLGGAPIKTTPRHTVGGKDFAPQLAYERTVLESPTGNPPTRFEVYMYREGRLQVAIVFGVPRNLDRVAPLQKKIELSLQSLRLGSEQQASSGTPSTTGSPSF